MEEVFKLPARIIEGIYKVLMHGTKEQVNISVTVLGRKLGVDSTVYLAEAQGQKGNQPTQPQQPPQAPATP